MRPLSTKPVEINIPPITPWAKCVRLRLPATINIPSPIPKPPRDTSSPAVSTTHTYRPPYKTLDPDTYHHLESP